MVDTEDAEPVVFRKTEERDGYREGYIEMDLTTFSSDAKSN